MSQPGGVCGMPRSDTDESRGPSVAFLEGVAPRLDAEIPLEAGRLFALLARVGISPLHVGWSAPRKE